MRARRGGRALLVALALASGCSRPTPPAQRAFTAAGVPLVPTTIRGANGTHVFQLELAATAEQQAHGLMARRDIPSDGGMLFAPYPAGGAAPGYATFWMKDTPSPLDVLFLRADGSIAQITADTVPLSETMFSSAEPVAAVIEINGGRAAALRIAVGDRVSWPEPTR